MNGKASDKNASGTQQSGAQSENNADKDNKTGGADKGTGTDAIALLKADHRTVEKLFKQFEEAKTQEEKSRIAKQVCTELIVHAKLEEEIFYAACRDQGVESDLLDEAQVEHDSAKLLISEILQQTPESPYYDAKVTVLGEYVKHHVGEEENASEGIFAKAKAAKLDMNALGQRLQTRKQELMGQQENASSQPPELHSLELSFIQSNQQEMSTMARQNEQERDEYGRFTGGGNDDYRRGGRGSNQSNDRERDEYGRFMSDGGSGSGRQSGSRGSYRDDDDYGSSSGRGSGGGGRYSSQYDDDDDYRGRSRSSQSYDRERDERGRFMSDDDRSGGYSGRSRDDDDYGYRSSSRGSSGRERDEQGRFMSDDDDDRGSRGSRGSSRGQGQGWFGDSEGHARAAEEGWRHRGSSSSSRYDRDDDRGGRSSSRYDSDDRGRSGSGSGSDDDGRGWYGDSRGHSEAARRGWQHRR